MTNNRNKTDANGNRSIMTTETDTTTVEENSPVCPFCGSDNVEHRFDEDGDRGNIPEETPVYKCLPCLSYFPDSTDVVGGNDTQP